MGATAPRRFRKIVASGLVTLLASAGMLILDAPAASAAAPTVVNSGVSGGPGAIPNWLETHDVERNDSSGGTGAPSDAVQGTLVVKHDTGRSVVGLAIDSNWDGTDNTPSIAPTTTGVSISTLPGGVSNYSTVRFSYSPPDHPSMRATTVVLCVFGGDSRPSGPQRVQAVLDDGTRTPVLTATVQQVLEADCSGAGEFPSLFSAQQGASEVGPGGVVNFQFKADDADGSGTNDAFDRYRWRVRRLNDGAIVQGPTCVDLAGSNSDNINQSFNVTFNNGRGRYVVETELGGENDGACPSGAFNNNARWWRIGAVDVNTAEATSPTLTLAGAPALVQAGNSYTVTATSADADSGGRVQMIEWDADGSPGFERRVLTEEPTGIVVADRTQLVTTTVGQCADRTVTARVTDNGAMNGSDPSSAQKTTATPVTEVNCAPVANNQTEVTNEDTPKSFSINPTDGDNNPLTFSVVDDVDDGAVSGTFPNFVYNPATNFNGTDTWTYQVSDGRGASDTAVVTFTVGKVNDKPVADDLSTSTSEDTTITIDVDPLISDPDEGDTPPQTLTISLQPPFVTGASLTGTNDITYNPPANFNGAVSIAYEVNDGQGLPNSTDQGVITITVDPIDDPPVANDQSVTTVEDTGIVVVLGPTQDVDGESITYTVPVQPDFGSVGVSGTNATYTPSPNFYGTDDFIFFADDGVSSVAGTITVTVTPVNDAPAADDQTVSTPEDTDLPITLTATDVDLPPDTLTFTVIAGPSNGTLDTTTGPNLVYTPDADYFGLDSLTFQVSDGNGGTDTGSISITVTPVNDPPIADDQHVDTDEDVPAPVLLTASDIDNTQAELAFTVTVPPTSGVLSGSGADLVYTPNLNFSGDDAFQFQVDDGDGGVDEGEVTITVAALNDPPSAIPQSLSTPEDTALDVVLDAVDPDDPTTDLTFQVIGGPSHGVLSATTGQDTTYTPDPDFNGYDTFVFQVTDPGGLDDVATVVIAVGDPGTNDPPVADDQAITTDEDVDAATVLTASDVEGDALTYSIEVAPLHGTAALVNDALIYSPNLNSHEDDFILFKVDDGNGGVAFGSIEITVTSVNDDPDAFPQTVPLVEDTPTPVTLDGSDVDGDTLAFSVVTQPDNGTLSGTAPNLTYTPDADYVGNDAFLFQVDDGQGGTDTAEVSFVVEEAPKTITSLEAHAVVASITRIPGTLKVMITIPLTAFLTDRVTGAPIGGKTIEFTVGNGAMHMTCTAVTNAQGRATCTNVLSTVWGVLFLGYNASFAGDADHTASSDGGPLLNLLGTEIL